MRNYLPNRYFEEESGGDILTRTGDLYDVNVAL